MYLPSQSQQWKYQGNAQILFQVNEFTQVFLLLTLVVFHTLFWCFHGGWEVELTTFDVLFSILFAGEDMILSAVIRYIINKTIPQFNPVTCWLSFNRFSKGAGKVVIFVIHASTVMKHNDVIIVQLMVSQNHLRTSANNCFSSLQVFSNFTRFQTFSLNHS